VTKKCFITLKPVDPHRRVEEGHAAQPETVKLVNSHIKGATAFNMMIFGTGPLRLRERKGRQ